MKSSFVNGAIAAAVAFCASIAPALAINTNPSARLTLPCFQPFLCNPIDSDADAFAGFIRIKGYGNVGELQVYPDSNCSSGFVLKSPTNQSVIFNSMVFDFSGYQDDTYGPFIFLQTQVKGAITLYEAVPADGTTTPLGGGFAQYTLTAADFGAQPGHTFLDATFQLFPYAYGGGSTNETLTSLINRPEITGAPGTVYIPKTSFNFCPLGFSDPRGFFLTY